MNGFGPEGVRVNPELESDCDKSDELNSDHDSDSDGPRYSDFNAGIDVVDHIFPNANVRNCVRHIYNNFKELHKGKALKDVVCVGPHVPVENGIKFTLALGTSMLWIFCNIHVLAENGTSLASLVSMQSQPFKKPIEETTMKVNKKAKKEADEVVNPKLSKKGQQVNCTKCDKTGHNKRTYRGEVYANQPIRRPPPSSQQQQPERHPSSSHEQHLRRQKILIRKIMSPPIVVRWMPNVPSSQQ
ncbi:hypothetical protein V6N13_065359 [Hibiscus sabdariffa]